jgi:hypothetical protein
MVQGFARLTFTVGALMCAAVHVSGADGPQPRTTEQVRAAAEALVKRNVAWREVQWRTCLLEGLRESRAAGKPLVLWVFIDRPIDDERC